MKPNEEMMVAVIACALAGCCTFSPEWRDRVAVADASLLACDAFQTVRFSDFGQWDLGEHGTPIREANPVLGERPSPTVLIAWLGANLAGVVAADRLRNRFVDAALVALGLVETAVVASNVRYGGACGLGPTNLVRVRDPQL